MEKKKAEKYVELFQFSFCASSVFVTLTFILWALGSLPEFLIRVLDDHTKYIKNHYLDATAYLCIVAYYIHPFMSTVCASSGQHAMSQSSDYLKLLSWTLK